MCISEPNFIQEMLMNPSLAKEHMELVHNALPKIHIFVLQVTTFSNNLIFLFHIFVIKIVVKIMLFNVSETD